MDLMHILPYSASLLQEGIEEGDESLDQVHIQYWRSVLDKIADGTIEWELFLSSYTESLLSHPISWLTSSQNGQTLFHLAVIARQYEVVKQLALSPQLKEKRNQFGHTPLETAYYLNHGEAIEILYPGPRPSFWEQSNVSFTEGVKKSSQAQHLEYLPRPVFESHEGLKEVFLRTQKAKQEDEIPTEKVWMGIYFDSEIKKQQNPAVAIRYIDAEVGFGAFADQRIPPCAFVGEYTGVVEERKPRHLKDKYYCVRYPAWQMGKRKFVIDAEKKGNFTRFINHSNKPNLSLQSVFWKGMPRMIFIAIQEISEGTQLTFDYGDIFWKEHSQIPRPFE